MYVAGIDIGGTKCAAVLGSIDAGGYIQLLDKITFKTADFPKPDDMLAQLMNGLQVLLSKNNMTAKNIAAIGVSCGGPLNSRDGIILSPPNLPGWDAVPVTAIFNQKFNVPAWLQNDANACALAEWKFGAGKDYQHLLFLTFGTGMGAGFILNQKLYSGTNDMAGEVGHMRMEPTGPTGYGKPGSFEGFCSGGGITQIAKSKVLEKLERGESISFLKNGESFDNINADVVADWAAKGDPLALEIYKISGSYLGRGLAVLIDLLNPEIIIIGSIFVKAGWLMREAMEKTLAEESLAIARNVCKIVPAGLGDNIGDYAALSVAANNIKN